MEERDGRGKTWWEVIWSGDSGRLLLHRRNTVHFKRTNEPPPKLTFEELPKVSSYPDETGDRVHLEESFATEEAPCMHRALQGHTGARPCWDDQNPFGANCEKTRPLQGLCDLKTCNWTLNLKPTIGIWVKVINDLRLFPVNIGSWTLKRDFSSYYACKHLFLNIVPLCNWHWAC